MKLSRKHWPFGTKKTVRIIDDASDMMIVAFEEATKEGFLIIGHSARPLPKKDDIGTIIFEQGGPMGGHWQYYPQAKTTSQ